MMELETLRLVGELAGNLGITVILLYLYIQERNDHKVTRQEHIQDLRQWVKDEHSHHDALDD